MHAAMHHRPLWKHRAIAMNAETAPLHRQMIGNALATSAPHSAPRALRVVLPIVLRVIVSDGHDRCTMRSPCCAASPGEGSITRPCSSTFARIMHELRQRKRATRRIWQANALRFHSIRHARPFNSVGAVPAVVLRVGTLDENSFDGANLSARWGHHPPILTRSAHSDLDGVTVFLYT